MPEIPLRFPVEGRDDTLAHSDQQIVSTRDSKNVRTRNPRKGRLSGARRAGWKKACDVALGADAPRGMASVLVDDRHISYTVLDTPETVWTALGPSGRDAHSVKVDVFGAVFVLEGGTHVTVYNSAGVQQDFIALPLTSGQVCRALAVEESQRIVFVAVSEGGLQADAKLWAYQEDLNGAWRILWETKPGMFIEKMGVRAGSFKLVAGLNDTDTGRAHVVTYGNLIGPPSEISRHQVPAPVSPVAVSPAGHVAAGSGVNADRGLDPRFPDTGQILDAAFRSYWVGDLANFSTRRWCIFNPVRLIEDGLEDGDLVHIWADNYGSNRIFTQTTVQVVLQGKRLTIQGSNPNAGDTLELKLPDDSVVETYTFVSSLTNPGDILRSATLTVSLKNLVGALNGGGNGTTSHSGTAPSGLVTNTQHDGNTAHLFCAPVHEVVEATLAYASTTQLTFSDGLSTGRTLSAKTVDPRPPRFVKSGMAGRPGVSFNGLNQKLVTEDNPNTSPSAANQQRTLYPGYGVNQSLALSARFVSFTVLRPAVSYSKACAIAQLVPKVGGGAWTRRIVSNLKKGGGDYEHGTLGVVENDGGTVRTHNASYLTPSPSNFILVTQVSNPTGDYEVYVNGEPALNGPGSHTGTAVGNDTTRATHMGQSGYAGPDDERFWKGEVYFNATVHLANAAPMTTAERQAYEGALAWHFGAAGALPLTHPYRSVPPPPLGGSTSDWYLAKQALTTTPIVTKLDGGTSDIAWMAASDTTTPDTIGALGYGLAWNSAGSLYSVGPPVVMAGPGSDTASVRMIVDKGSSFSLDTVDGAWSADLGTAQSETFTYDKLELAVDSFDNLFVPFQADRYAQGPPPQFLMYDKAGALLLSPDAEQAQAGFSVAIQKPEPDLTNTNATRAEYIDLALRREATSVLQASGNATAGDSVSFSGQVASTPVVETYNFVAAVSAAYDVKIGTDAQATLANLKAAVNSGAGAGTLYGTGTPRSGLVSGTTITATQLTFAARQYTVPTLASAASLSLVFVPADPLPFVPSTGNVRQMRLTQTALVTGSTRTHIETAIVGQDFVKFAQGYAQIVTGGTGVFESNARYWHSVELGGKVFSTDGKNAFVYDPKTDKVERFAAKGAGTVPAHARIFEAYRARLVAIGAVDLPSRLYWSKTANPFNWDYAPPVRIPGQAWNSGLPPTFDIPDVVNGWASISDDLAIVFGDHTIWRQTGDPAPGGNGQVHVITRNHGGAFGRAWTIGPSGEVFFWSTSGELMVIPDGVSVQPISRKRLERAFGEIDPAQFFVRMAWDTRADELMIVFCPYGDVDEPSRYFAWERRVDALWEDEITAATHQITDLIVTDGDRADDRRTIWGCADGRARTWDETARDDDGEEINSYVTIGPIATTDDRFEVKLSRLQVLLDNQSCEAFVELWTSDVPSTTGVMRQRFTLRPGRSPILPARVRGNYVWVVVRAQDHWAFESATAIVEPGGYKRTRVYA